MAREWVVVEEEVSKNDEAQFRADIATKLRPGSEPFPEDQVERSFQTCGRRLEVVHPSVLGRGRHLDGWA